MRTRSPPSRSMFKSAGSGFLAPMAKSARRYAKPRGSGTSAGALAGADAARSLTSSFYARCERAARFGAHALGRIVGQRAHALDELGRHRSRQERERAAHQSIASRAHERCLFEARARRLFAEREQLYK